MCRLHLWKERGKSVARAWRERGERLIIAPALLITCIDYSVLLLHENKINGALVWQAVWPVRYEAAPLNDDDDEAHNVHTTCTQRGQRANVLR